MIPNFEDGALGVRRDANGLVVVAMTLASSDYDVQEKAAAVELVKAGAVLAQAKDSAEVNKAFKEVLAARAKKGAAEFEAGKVAELAPLMKNALPSLSTNIKRLTRNEKTFLRGRNSKKVVDDSTIMFAIAYGCQFNVDETLTPSDEGLWYEYCQRLADSALEFNKEANAVAKKSGSFDAMKDAYKNVEATCTSMCHEKFGGKTAE